MATKKKQHIGVFTNADKAIYKVAYATGGFSLKDAITVAGNTEAATLKRLKSHIKDGYLQVETDTKQKGQEPEYKYTLTRKGQDKCRQINNVGYAYKAAGERHDKALRQEIIKDLTDKDKEIAELRTEKDWNRVMDSRIQELRNSSTMEDREQADRIEQMRVDGKLSPPDGGYVTTAGEVVAVEVVTRFYSPEQREAKEEFARIVGASYREIDIN